MRLATSPRILHIGRDDKVAKLKDFISTAIAAELTQAQVARNEFTIICRAPDSPVAIALAAFAAEIASAGIRVRAIGLEPDGAPEDAACATLLDLKGIEFRLLQDHRFMAAHEQLVLGDKCLWIGDCMRRDPAKRDAFEIFHHNDGAAARHGAVSFTRLWKHAKPMKRVKAANADLVIAGQKGKTAKAERRPATRR